MNNFKDFFANYGGIVIGIAVAILLILTRLYVLIIGIVVIFVCAYAGNYIQKNKEQVKEKLKNFIDKM